MKISPLPFSDEILVFLIVTFASSNERIASTNNEFFSLFCLLVILEFSIFIFPLSTSNNLDVLFRLIELLLIVVFELSKLNANKLVSLGNEFLNWLSEIVIVEALE